MRLRELEQVVHVLGPCRARLLDERAEDALVAGHRAGVRGRGRRSGRRLAHLQHRHAHAALGAVGERVAQERAVAVRLQVQRDRAHAVVARERGRPLGRVHRDRVPARDHRVEAEGRAAWPARSRRRCRSATRARPVPARAAAARRPTSWRREWSATIPLPFGPHTGSEWRAAASRSRRSCSAPSATSPKPAPYTIAPPQPERARLVHDLRHARRRDAPRPRRPAPPAARTATGSRGSRAPPRASGSRPRPARRSPPRAGSASVSPAYESSRSLAPTTATLCGRSSRPSSISAAYAPRRGAPARGR